MILSRGTSLGSLEIQKNYYLNFAIVGYVNPHKFFKVFSAINCLSCDFEK